MAINREFVGREYTSPEPYEVTRVKIREFADSIGDANPVYRDTATARAAGYPEVIAPPTFAIIMGMEGAGQAMFDPDLRLDFSRVVHGDQSFRHSRPIRAGDLLTCVSRIRDVKALGGNELLTVDSDITTVDGEHVVTASNMMVVRGTAAQDS